MARVKDSKIYQLRIDIAGIRPPLWRRIAVRGNTTLNRLHDILQVLFGWSGYHLHEFEIGGMEFTDDRESQAEFGMRSEMRVSLDALGLAEGMVFTYLYDFGDGWDHRIKVEKVLPSDPTGVYPVCLTGKRAGPLEDCGGPWGHAEIVDLLKQVAEGKIKRPSWNEGPPDEEDEEVDYEVRERLEWVGEDYDPEAFDLEAINAALKPFQH